MWHRENMSTCEVVNIAKNSVQSFNDLYQTVFGHKIQVLHKKVPN
jgi:hypothetical protein